jgi:hypothetical protein
MPKKLTKSLTLLVAGLVAAAVIAGCGGSSSSDSPSFSKAEFVKRANTICTKTKKTTYDEFATYAKKYRSGSQEIGEKVIARALQLVLLPNLQTEAEEIRALGTPKQGGKTVEEFLAALEKAVSSGTQGSQLSEAQIEQLLQPSVQIAKKYGIDQCALG